MSAPVRTRNIGSKRAGELASAYSPKVVNVLTFGPVGAQEVLLQVKFAEVDRTALTQLGVNFVSTGGGNTIGTITTGQFGGFGPQNLTQTKTPNGTTTTTSGETLNNVLNLFLFRPDINFGAVIEALQTKNLLQILAEPNLIAVNGKEATFEGRTGSEHTGLRQCSDHFRIHGARVEYASGRNRVRIAGRAEFRNRGIDG